MTLTQITEKGIKDGEIVNADINASAAIAGSKIAPDFGSQNIATTGTVGSGDITISGTAPRLILTDSNNNSDFRLNVDAGLFSVQDTSNSFASRLEIGSDGRFRVGCTAQPSSTVGGFQLDMGSYPGTLRLMSGAGASGTQTASLAIGGSNHHANLHNGANSGGALNLYNYNSSDGNSTAISFHNSNGLGIGRILGHNESHSNRLGNLVFMVSDGTYPQEAMRLTHDGRLGIGTTDPSSGLHIVAGNDRSSIRLENTYDTPDNVWELQPGISGVANTGFCIRDITDSANRFVIDGSGNIGIGLNSPTARLHASAPYNVTGAKISGGASGYSNALEVSNAGGTNLLTVKGDGAVGIGTTSPSDKLEIRAGGIYLHSESQASSGALSNKLRFLKYHTSSTGAEYEIGRIEPFTQNGYNGGLNFYYSKHTGSGNYAITKGLTLQETGALLIGTDTNPTDSSCNLRVNFDQSTSSGRAIEISHETNGADKAGAAFGLVLNNNGESTNAADLTLQTANGGSLGTRMTVKSDGNVSIDDGNLILASGHGIDFHNYGSGTNISSNLLDDYEEGTWTPFVGTQSGSDYTISSSYNCYTKIGNIVHAYFSYTFTAEGNGSISLFNLPFSADSSVALVGQGYVTSGNTRLSLQFIKYTANIVLPRVDDGVNYQTYWTGRGSWAPTNTFVCHITYKV